MNIMKQVQAKLSLLVAVTFVALIGLNASPLMSRAASNTITDPQQSARVSFTFDDGLASAYNQAAPTLAKYGLTGTDYIITGCVGMTTTPNTCRANTATPYMSWSQIQALQNSYGWEIGSHTVDHDCLASSAAVDPSDCQTNALTTAQVDAELANSKAALAANGINATDFAPPYGDYSNSVMAEIAKYYASMRQFKNANNNANTWPNSDYYLQDFVVQEKTDPVSTVEAAINNAITNKQWLVLTFHNIETKPSSNPDNYEYGTSELAQIAAYVQAKEQAGTLQASTVNQGLVTSPTNLLPNGSFNDGIADGWRTDNPSAVTADSGNNGSYPDPTNSVKFVANGQAGRLYSPEIAVNANTQYMLKTFLNVQSLTSGDVEFYIDEYDSNGNWISGQYKGAETSSFVEDYNFAYTPSSQAVAKADIQITVAPNSGITAYVDNAQWFPLTATATPPTDLLPNSTFDTGITDGWTTDDPADITADSGNNGSPSDPVNSVKLVSSTTTKNGHLFSPAVAVDPTKTYSMTDYLNIKSLNNGVVAFYIDEYDANGNWISGQYKTDTHTLGSQTVSFQYKPSSASVAKASLQVIVVGNSGTVAYLDDSNWYAN
jgi:peptidoglycan/xylan/chitin deacetylase (PgdA/CDA1 family)